MARDVTGTASSSSASPGDPPPARHAPPLALYRRYRPATFAEVKGQEHVTEPLRQALRGGRVHHAYLFSGPRGCGKTSSARILARSLNCVQGPTPDPCGECESCVALAPAGPGSIDVIEIDAASHGGVDDARDLRERAFYAPVSGRFKVYIIDEAHMVTREGFNALLKLVEEPPAHVKFVFATTEPEKVLPTIRSRTHHYPFRLVPPPVLRELLETILTAEGAACEPAVLPLVVRAGAGSVRDALSVLDQLLAGAGEGGLTYEMAAGLLGYSDDAVLDAMVDAIAAGDGAAVFGAVDRVVQGGHDPRRFAADLLDRLRDLIILAAVPGAGKTGLLDAPEDRLAVMAAQAGRFGQAELTRTADLLSAGLVEMRGTTAPRLMLELTCARILAPGASGDEAALLARIERLERGGAQATAPAAPGRTGAAPPPRARGAQDGGPADDGPSDDGSAHAAGGAPGRSRGAPSPGPSGPAPASGPPGGGTPPPASGSSGGGTPRASGLPAGEARVAAATPEQGAAPTAPAAGERPPTAAVPPTAVPPDAEALRARWPDVLDAVRDERRVAWMLLRSAEVASLENGLLTVVLPREGEVMGFASSGCDKVLTNVLATLLGLRVRVRAEAAGAAGAVGAAPRAREAAGGPGGGPPPSAPPPAPSAPRAAGTSEARAEESKVRAGARPAGGARGGPGARDLATAKAGASDVAAAGVVSPGAGAEGDVTVPSAGPGPAPAVPRPAAPPAGESRRSVPPAGSRRPGPRSGSSAARRGAGQADSAEEWPDDASEPGATPGTGDLSPVELLRRQLGGQVIEEIDEP